MASSIPFASLYLLLEPSQLPHHQADQSDFGSPTQDAGIADAIEDEDDANGIRRLYYEPFC